MRVLFILILSLILMVEDSFARAGKGKSSGFRNYNTQEFNYKKPQNTQPQTSTFSNQHSHTTQPISSKPSFLSSPIFKWLVGGMIFGALLSFLLGYGFNVGMPGLLEILLLGGVFLFLYKMLKKRQEPQPQPVPGGSIYNQSYESYALSSTLPNINQELILNLAKNAFLDIQKAWSEGDLSKVRNFTTDRMFNYLMDQLRDMQSQGLRNIVKDPQIKSIDIVHVEEEGDRKVVVVEIQAEAIDYTVDNTGKVVEGSSEVPANFKEYWAFVGKALDWRLDDIRQIS